MKLYKVLVDGKSCHGGSMEWSLPKRVDGKWTPGKWHEISGQPLVCQRGFHLTRDATQWLKIGCKIFAAQGEGRTSEDGDGKKIAFERARLLKPVAAPRWWCDVEAFVATLKTMDWLKPDGKPLKGWKLFLNDDPAAAWNAARAAAWNAARDAAWDAAYAARAAAYAARAAAWNAAGNAAWAAAWDAAWDAAYAARAAAWNAARDAAGDAAGFASINIVCGDLKIDASHFKAIEDRWNVWKKGYGLCAEVGGVLYVYGTTKKE